MSEIKLRRPEEILEDREIKKGAILADNKREIVTALENYSGEKVSVRLYKTFGSHSEIIENLNEWLDDKGWCVTGSSTFTNPDGAGLDLVISAIRYPQSV